MKGFYLIIVLGGLFFSCRPKPIDIEVQSAEPKLVVFTHVVPDNIMLVAVTKSFSALDGNTTDSLQKVLLSGAIVELSIGNQSFSFYELSPGLYASYTAAFQVDQDYHLRVIHGTDTVSSTTKMLPKINFNSVVPTVEKLASDTNVYLNFSFTDNPAVSNWYLINVYKKQTDTVGVDNVNYFENGNNKLARSILISDKEFSGTYQSNIHFSELNAKDSIVVTLSNINEAYFNYLGYQVGNSGNVLNALNLEPISYPTNIINGYGFFNTHFPDIKFFDLGEY
jgi:hypothetical protein